METTATTMTIYVCALFGNGWGSYNVNGWIPKKILSKKQIRLCSLDCQKFPLFFSSGISFLFMLKVFSFLISSFYSKRPFQETVWIYGTVQFGHTHKPLYASYEHWTRFSLWNILFLRPERILVRPHAHSPSPHPSCRIPLHPGILTGIMNSPIIY